MSIEYSIYCDAYPILDWGLGITDLIAAKGSREISSRIFVAEASITMLPQHPYYDIPEMMKSTITIKRNGAEILHGRISSIDTDKYAAKQLKCESDFKFLRDVPDMFNDQEDSDSTTRRAAFQTAVQKIFCSSGANPLTGYNKYVPAERRIYFGGIDNALLQYLDTLTYDDFKIEKSLSTTIESRVQSWMNDLEAYAKIEKDSGVYKIYFTKDCGENNDSFEVALDGSVESFITDYKHSIAVESLYTAVHVVGKASSSDSTVEISANDGDTIVESGYKWDNTLKLVYNEAAVSKYGKVIKYEEVSFPENVSSQQDYLKRTAVRELKKSADAFETFDISAVDPRLVGYTNAESVLGAYYRVRLPILSSAVRKPLTKDVFDILQMSNEKLTFGDKRRAISDNTTRATVTANAAKRTAEANATPSQIREAIAASESRYGDYISEVESASGWRSEVLQSGEIKLYGSSIPVTWGSWSAWGTGTGFSWAVADVTLPKTFADTDYVVEVVRSGGHTVAIIGIAHSSVNTFRIAAVLPTSSIDSDNTSLMDITVTGRGQQTT